MHNISKNNEKPEYGWFVKDLIVAFSIIGFIGIIFVSLGIFLTDLLQLFFIFAGIFIIVLFLWPGLGMAVMNIILDWKDDDITDSFDEMKRLEIPIILDIGCGTGRTAMKIVKALENGGHLYGIDIYNKMAISGNDLERVRKNAQLEGVAEKTTFQYGTATEIPFEDESFDIVNVSSVLHEIHDREDQKKAIKEIYRVLKPSGTVYIGEWNSRSAQLIGYMGIFCFVFKPSKYWEYLLKESNLTLMNVEEKGGFVLFTAQK
ncbi:MAG: hypothetical protein BAJALOKI3v1_200028 [Promethearchaeota archaeon]|nr:MAG: hypothetical protein BAJALOKI3v1_200028 [Candidatus Lokiarchaeota archaeon]